ncbi:hypothetical protein [Metabacillus fastidiosus]|uniref:hypothetical protein n=1 Tax=Metabacillus fastidiosus TaxID=1458 RepID=UPI003D2BA451
MTKEHELKEDIGYIAFDKLMDTVFDLAEELHDKNTAITLTNKEYKFLEALGNYCEVCEELDNEESE